MQVLYSGLSEMARDQLVSSTKQLCSEAHTSSDNANGQLELK